MPSDLSPITNVGDGWADPAGVEAPECAGRACEDAVEGADGYSMPSFQPVTGKQCRAGRESGHVS